MPYAAQGHELSLPEGSDAAKTEFENLVQELHLYRTSMEDPPPELVKKCRNVCQLFAGRQRKQWIEEFRKLLPCGTTGIKYVFIWELFSLPPFASSSLLCNAM